MSLAPLTRPELVKEDFVVPGENNPEHFKYPFSYNHSDSKGLLPDQMPLIPTLERTKVGNEDYFVDPEIDLQQTLNSRKGPIIEVAGPTHQGYIVLNSTELPSRPLITNVAGTYKPEGIWTSGSKSIGGIDALTLDALSDVKHLPFASESVGILLASCLPRLNMDREDIDLISPYGVREFKSEVSNTWQQASQKLMGNKPSEVDLSEEAQNAPRLAFWLEAQRTLTAGGIVIYRGAFMEDLGMAWQVGFNIIAHNERRVTSAPNGTQIEEELPHEIIFQKIDNS